MTDWPRISYAAIVTICAALLAAACTTSAKPAALGLRTLRHITLPGDTSRFDYVSLDPTRRRLYVSHLGASQIVVVDTTTLAVEQTLSGVSSVHGVLAVPSINRVFAAATGADQAVAYDATTLQEVGRASTGRAPDGLAYDPDTDAVFLSNESGTTVTEIDASTGQRRGDIDIGGEAGNVVYDPASKHILVDVQTRDDVVDIDPRTHQIVARHPVPGCDHDHGLQVDPDHHRVFVACDGNAKLVELDLTTFTVVTTTATGAEPDVLTLDPQAHRLYVLAESGVAMIVDTSVRPATLIAKGLLAHSAHSGIVDPSTHRLYVPIADADGHPELRVLDTGT